MSKRLNQWLDEFVKSGTNPNDVVNWPDDIQKKDYLHYIRLTFLDESENTLIYHVSIRTDYETAITKEQFENLFIISSSTDYDYMTTLNRQTSDDSHGPTVLGYNSDLDKFYDFVSGDTLTLTELHDIGRESND